MTTRVRPSPRSVNVLVLSTDAPPSLKLNISGAVTSTNVDRNGYSPLPSSATIVASNRPPATGSMTTLSGGT